MSKFKINIHEVIFHLSDVLNLVSDNQTDHGKRVAYMAAECVKVLNWDREWIDDLFFASILHDCGVSKTTNHERLVNFSWKTSENHCVGGAKLLNASTPLAYLSEYILHHHIDWKILRGVDLSDKVKMSANCINMVDTVDFLLLHYQQQSSCILSNKENIRKEISKKSDSEFNPQLVDAFLKVSEPEAFWFAMNKDYNAAYAKTWMEHKANSEVDFIDLKEIVLFYSRMVDAKSSYTKYHSEGVGRLARYLGELFNLPEQTCDKLELAGLLHDLGNLRVPDSILNTTKRLTDTEFLIMQQHSYDTYDIIKDIKGFEDISIWASKHHERSDGSGYPFRCNSTNLTLEAKIIAIAEIFQGYTQGRPHREKISAIDTLKALNLQVKKDKLDKDIVIMIEQNLDECWKAANLI